MSTEPHAAHDEQPAGAPRRTEPAAAAELAQELTLVTRALFAQMLPGTAQNAIAGLPGRGPAGAESATDGVAIESPTTTAPETAASAPVPPVSTPAASVPLAPVQAAEGPAPAGIAPPPLAVPGALPGVTPGLAGPPPASEAPPSTLAAPPVTPAAAAPPAALAVPVLETTPPPPVAATAPHDTEHPDRAGEEHDQAPARTVPVRRSLAVLDEVAFLDE